MKISQKAKTNLKQKKIEQKQNEREIQQIEKYCDYSICPACGETLQQTHIDYECSSCNFMYDSWNQKILNKKEENEKSTITMREVRSELSEGKWWEFWKL